uniref:Integrase zinc-binding domain-containing protein n=1 Tax=Peronospora matthiolae TaxID=2874970 RepID=A0AAV1VEI0_9STRA
MYECHDASTSGHRSREKTYLMVSRDFYWPRQDEFVRKYIRSCEVCQQVKPIPSSRAALQPLPVPAECWQSVSMDFIFGFPKDAHTNTGIFVFVHRFSKMVHLVAVPESITAHGVLVSSSILSSDFTGYPVNSCLIGTPASQRISGNPCSVHLELV